MKPVKVIIEGNEQVSSKQFCEQLLDLKRWTVFAGYGILSQIKTAEFRKRTKQVVGTQVFVTKTDGSTHVETIEKWEPTERVQFRIDAFSKPLIYVLRYVEDEFVFTPIEGGTHVKRTIQLYPVNFGGKLFLWYVARHLRKTLKIQAKMQL